MNAIVCPKCQHIRKYTDAAPIWQCPSCKTAYAKVLQAKDLSPKSIDEERFEEPEEYAEDSTRRRIKGFFFIVGGSVGFALALAFSAYLAKNGYISSRGGPPLMGLLAIAIIMVLIGFIELLTGGKFRQLSEKWDGLRNWQKGVLVVVIAFSPLLIIAIGMKIFLG